MHFFDVMWLDERKLCFIPLFSLFLVFSFVAIRESSIQVSHNQKSIRRYLKQIINKIILWNYLQKPTAKETTRSKARDSILMTFEKLQLSLLITFS